VLPRGAYTGGTFVTVKIKLTGKALKAALRIQELRIQANTDGIKLRAEIEDKVKQLEDHYIELMDVEWAAIWEAEGITFPRADPFALTVTPNGEAYLSPVGTQKPKLEIVH